MLAERLSTRKLRWKFSTRSKPNNTRERITTRNRGDFFFVLILASATPSVILRNINPGLPLFSPVEQPQPPEERGIYSLK